LQLVPIQAKKDLSTGAAPAMELDEPFELLALHYSFNIFQLIEYRYFPVTLHLRSEPTPIGIITISQPPVTWRCVRASYF
jgi:hypothetical protein